MTTSSSQLSARQDLEPYVKKLFSTDSSSEKPRVYFCAYFNMPNFGDEPNIPNQPHNMFIASGPDESISPDNSVIQARKIFMTICPGEEFLPRPPDPEDIIYCDDESRKSKSSAEDFSSETEAGGTQEAILEQHSPNEGETSSEKTNEPLVPT